MGAPRKTSLRRTNSSQGYDYDHQPSTSASSTNTQSPRRTSSPMHVISGREDDDGRLLMREREREREESIGKAGGVGVGVTRPKRRLSSLPSLPHPIHTTLYNDIHQRPFSSSTSPNGYIPTTSSSHSSNPSSSSYHALSGGGLSSGLYNKMDEKTPLAGYTAAPSKPVEQPPKLFGIELKWISLITLALQNAFLTIIMHYSRISAAPNKAYSAASAVLLNELLKGSISVLIALRRIDTTLSSQPISEKSSKPLYTTQSTNTSRFLPTMFHSSRLTNLRQSVFSPDCYKLSVPAILYVIQNNLQYVAASNLDVATFQVTYQMKILTTAFFSVLMLRKRLTRTKWISLLLLAVGVGIVQIQTTSAPSHSSPSTDPSDLDQEFMDILEPSSTSGNTMQPWKGFVAVILACMTSGLAGVYFELILKTNGSSTGNTPAPPPPDLWIRNTQLSLFSLIPALAPILFSRSNGDGIGWLGRVMASFSNFNGWAIGTVLTQTLGGLITAIVIRYSDNIMKGFATSLSIIISFLASVALFSYPITISFIFGSTIVLLSTYIYNSPSSSNGSSSSNGMITTRKEVAVAPGSPIGSRAPIIGEPEKPSRVSSVVSLLGLQSSSHNNSAKPSFTDLRSAAGGFSMMSGNGNGSNSNNASVLNTPNSIHSTSIPGTPYFGNTNGNGNGQSTGTASAMGFALPPPRGRSPTKNLKGPNGEVIVVPTTGNSNHMANGGGGGGVYQHHYNPKFSMDSDHSNRSSISNGGGSGGGYSPSAQVQGLRLDLGLGKDQ